MFTKSQFVKFFVLAIICLAAVGITNSSAAVNDHFNNNSLDPAWNVAYDNASGWTYSESGTNLSVTGIATINSSVESSSVRVWQNFSAPGDFEIKSGISWDSGSTYNSMQWLVVKACSSNTAFQDGYVDYWVSHSGQKVARIGDSLMYDSGMDTLPLAGSAEITMKRTNGFVSILWNNDVILSGSSSITIDKLELLFLKSNYPDGNFGTLSVDYVNAVPEPATICLFAFAGLILRKKK
jgi:hypothetical protein